MRAGDRIGVINIARDTPFSTMRRIIGVLEVVAQILLWNGGVVGLRDDMGGQRPPARPWCPNVVYDGSVRVQRGRRGGGMLTI